MSRVAIALVHHPVLDRQGETITTAITNLDLHDLARSARTYDATDYFVVHPVAAQRELAERVKAHWTAGGSGQRIPTREAALSLVRVVPAIEDAYEALGGRAAIDVIVTAAQRGERATTFAEARERLAASERPTLVVFGTGWGLAPALLASADVRLAPIRGPETSGYNHLSVRAACAIVLDRLLGPRDA